MSMRCDWLTCQHTALSLNNSQDWKVERAERMNAAFAMFICNPHDPYYGHREWVGGRYNRLIFCLSVSHLSMLKTNLRFNTISLLSVIRLLLLIFDRFYCLNGRERMLEDWKWLGKVTTLLPRLSSSPSFYLPHFSTHLAIKYRIYQTL